MITKITMSIFLFLSISTFSQERSLQLDQWESIRIPVKSWIEIKNAHLVKQEYDFSCGAAAVATILKYFFNEDISEKEVLDFVLKKKGIDKSDKEKLEEKEIKLSFYDLKEFVEIKNYKALGLALNLETLKKLKVPAIIFLTIRKKEHFSVYKGMDEKFIYLADPSFGNMRVTYGKFKEMFYSKEVKSPHGKIFVFTPTDEKKNAYINMDFMKIPKSSDFVYRLIKGYFY